MVAGSMMSQRMLTVVCSKNGSMTAVVGSSARIMSDSLIPFQPEMEEPSNILPSRNRSSSTSFAGIVTCCSLPRVSVKRRSAYLTSLSLINLITSAGFIVGDPLGRVLSLGLNAFAVPATDSFLINGLHAFTSVARTSLVHSRGILLYLASERCPQGGFPHLHEAIKCFLMELSRGIVHSCTPGDSHEPDTHPPSRSPKCRKFRYRIVGRRRTARVREHRGSVALE